MQIQAEVMLPYPREQVYAAYRDRLPELIEFLPNIRGIRVLSREEPEAGVVELVNEWTGGGEIPAAVRSVLSESMIRWTDHATWRSARFLVAWRTDVHVFPGAVSASGENWFIEVPGGTRFELRGELVVDATRLPGVPKLLAKSVGGAAEKMLAGAVSENAVEVAKGVGKLLAKQG